MSGLASCPICGPVYGGEVESFPAGGDYDDLKCDVCGRFQLAGSENRTTFQSEDGGLSDIQRALLSHRLVQNQNSDTVPKITSYLLDDILEHSRLPHPSTQATNFIRLIGDRILNTGEPLFLDKATPAKVGALNTDAVERLCSQLLDKKLVIVADKLLELVNPTQMAERRSYDLTLDGWERYDDEKRGRLSGQYGFVALKFGDSILDPFLNEVIKPIVKEGLGYNLVDMRDVAQAGIIDKYHAGSNT